MYNKTAEILGYDLRARGAYIYEAPVKVLLQMYLTCLKSGRLKKYMNGKTEADKRGKKDFVFLKTYLDMMLKDIDNKKE